MDPAKALVRTALNGTSLVTPRLAGYGASRLFPLALARSAVRPAEARLLAEATTGRLRLGGREVVTHRWGSGERPVLLVHGWRSRGSRMTAFVPGLLQAGYSPLTFDAPGHGASTGRGTTVLDYQEIIGRLHGRYGDFEAIVAHSLGVLGTFRALHSGVHAARVVALSGVAEFGFLADEFCAILRLRPRIGTELRRQIETRLFPGEPDIWTRFSATYQPEATHARLLLIHDADDDTVHFEQSRRMLLAYGDTRARLITTHGLGHRRILGDPEVLGAALEFIGPAAVLSGSEAAANRP
ncbi:alpha/beta hydrolase [Streptomyces sp. N2-109]|uniref:Alpha/beta hydrolase n=1 Tax=Streptomyces gossypii TaxID=2883101 RepID=A0ABT2JXG4_9ACTN|nr:alpha/beta hydrolase [Streptomyces gossypii]MCT2592580.1 alpha/beta hydrolase [Streptomyces gossypii]